MTPNPLMLLVAPVLRHTDSGSPRTPPASLQEPAPSGKTKRRLWGKLPSSPFRKSQADTPVAQPPTPAAAAASTGLLGVGGDARAFLPHISTFKSVYSEDAEHSQVCTPVLHQSPLPTSSTHEPAGSSDNEQQQQPAHNPSTSSTTHTHTHALSEAEQLRLQLEAAQRALQASTYLLGAERCGRRAAETALAEEHAARRGAEQDVADARCMLKHTDRLLGEEQKRHRHTEQQLKEALEAARRSDALAAAAKQQHYEACKALRREETSNAWLRHQMQEWQDDQQACVRQAAEDAEARLCAERQAAEANAARMQTQLACQQALQQAEAQVAAAWEAAGAAVEAERRQAGVFIAFLQQQAVTDRAAAEAFNSKLQSQLANRDAVVGHLARTRAAAFRQQHRQAAQLAKAQQQVAEAQQQLTEARSQSQSQPTKAQWQPKQQKAAKRGQQAKPVAWWCRKWCS